MANGNEQDGDATRKKESVTMPDYHEDDDMELLNTLDGKNYVPPQPISRTRLRLVPDTHHESVKRLVEEAWAEAYRGDSSVLPTSEVVMLGRDSFVAIFISSLTAALAALKNDVCERYPFGIDSSKTDCGIVLQGDEQRKGPFCYNCSRPISVKESGV